MRLRLLYQRSRSVETTGFTRDLQFRDEVPAQKRTTALQGRIKPVRAITQMFQF
jgi:hypothetical protein